MKNNTSIFSTLYIALIYFVTLTAFSGEVESKIMQDNRVWNQNSYSPKLHLQPYFKFGQAFALKATACLIQDLPFWEGFNKDSPSMSCWTIVDNNKDSASPLGNNIWRMYNYLPFEGDQFMYFAGGINNDDWLISPTFKMDPLKTYKLTYQYKTNTYSNNEFEVLASNKGLGLNDFTRIIVDKRIYKNDSWTEQKTYITNLSGDVNLAWHVTSVGSVNVFLDAVSIQEVACIEPENLVAKKIKTSQVNLSWDDKINASWEYFIEVAGGNGPLSAGVAATTTEVNVVRDNNNNNLVARTKYEYYVRAKCANGTFGEWIGPASFTTACSTFNLPFSDGFNTSSTTLSCWTILDSNKDRLPSGDNAWKVNNYSTYEGNQVMLFQSYVSNALHDDWLISPTLNMTGGIYAISYYYKTTYAYDNDFEILLSTDGTEPSDFKMVVESKVKRNAANYVKKTVYVKDVIGNVNLAWHLETKGPAVVYIDLVTIDKVDCIAPENDVIVSDIEKDKAKFTWQDSHNTNWEYFVRAQGTGGVPVGSGVLSNNKSVTVSKTTGTGGTNLLPNTWYEFFVRASCGPGKSSVWVGPIAFLTSCDVVALPFWEGFNKTSNTAVCWTIVDNNKDWIAPFGYGNIWNIDSSGMFEGDQGMFFYGDPGTPQHDDWLISPSIKLDANKYYRIKYHYKTSSYYKNDFEVLLSEKGTAVSNFTNKLLVKKGHSSDEWAQEVLVLKGTGSTINLAWHVNTANSYTYFNLDNVFVEEINGCPEPLNLGSKGEKANSATIFWSDNFGTSWEYVVQKRGLSVPIVKGTTTNLKENVINKDQSGNNLDPSTDYDFYVRMICGGGGEYSEWSGPFQFTTACSVFKVPFWEGFNLFSASLKCWTIIDENKDSTPLSSSNIWSLIGYNQFEGTHAMSFNVYDYSNVVESSDWLISPTITFEKNKMYRLKYHFKTNIYNEDSEFEVLASNSGTQPADFKRELVKSQRYKIENYQQNTVFINDLDGDVNLAWHVKGTGVKAIFIDNVFVEEVTGCPEPLKLEVTDIDIKKATISWTDAYNASSWEYFVQEKGKGIPVAKGILTNKKENVLTQDQSGKNLEPNTEYEFYVRTVCSAGGYSIWSGPITFVTLCSTYQAPFWEGFNSDSKSVRCWSSVNKYGTIAPLGGNWKTYPSAYEGDQSVFYYAYNGVKEEAYNDWLISPTITLDGGMYVLKYHYKTLDNNTFNNEFEVLLSTQGADVSKFTTTVLGTKNYREDNYVEEVVFFNVAKGEINLAWHVHSKNTNFSYLYLDNIYLKKVEGCPEPTAVKISNHSTTSMDVEWKQTGGVNNWEVILVDYTTDEKGVPVKTVLVTTTPSTTISGLDAGKAYAVYVRAKCTNGISNSDWSTRVVSGTEIGANDDCSGALNIPINLGEVCGKKVTGSFVNATFSVKKEPTCSGSPTVKKDVWFEFTATSKEHMLNFSDYFSLSKQYYPYIYVSLYDQPCSGISDIAKECFSFNDGVVVSRLLQNLVIGQKYYLRLATTLPAPDFYFSLCITTPAYIDVSLSGDKYTVEQLVKDVLVVADCDLVSNVTYSTGTNFGNEPNGIGYFDKNNSNFPFKNGIVLATNGVETSRGPQTFSQSDGSILWLGDNDLQDLLVKKGQTRQNYNASVLEFDFIPLTDTLKFDFIFASNEYGPSFQCTASDVFAFLLTDLQTNEQTNLAVVPGTDVPVAVAAIRDEKYQGTLTCGSTNEQYFDKFYGDLGLDVRNNPINYSGRTTPMTATSAVKAGRKYHIKLAIANYENTFNNSAVFLAGGSFDLGSIDLGEDLLIETANAICYGKSKIIKSGVTMENAFFKWFKDGVIIPGADQTNLEVSETGLYKVVVTYDGLNCESTGSVRVEVYPKISEKLGQPKSREICRNSLQTLVFDLTTVQAEMLVKEEQSNYIFTYYKTKAAAEAKIDAIGNVKTFELAASEQDVKLYILIEDKKTGCSEIFEWTFVSTTGLKPEIRTNVAVCAKYTFPELEKDQYYYTGSAATGKKYKEGDVIQVPGTYIIYVLQDNGAGCYEETSYQLVVTEDVKADVFKDEILECQFYQLKPLSQYNKYFTQANGAGVELYAGDFIMKEQTIYVYAASPDSLCTDESSFNIAYTECPIPKGISPNGDGLNDTFDLTPHGVTSLIIYNRYGREVFAFNGTYTNQWYGQDKGKNQLPDGTYYYVLVNRDNLTKTGWVQINK